MNTIGEKIAQLRKARGMTQEELSAVIGVSPQSVSKWETGATMPDILLLPVIADVFEVSTDALFGREKPQGQPFPVDEVTERAYDALLNCMALAWPQVPDADTPEVFVKKQRKFMEEYPESQTALFTNSGGAVYANGELGLIFRKPAQGGTALLKNEKADELLKALTDSSVKAAIIYLLKNAGLSYTASSAAKKIGLPPEEAQRTLDFLLKYRFADARDVNMDEEQVRIYSMNGTHKMLFVYTIYALAGRLADYQGVYYGFQGAGIWPDTVH